MIKEIINLIKALPKSFKIGVIVVISCIIVGALACYSVKISNSNKKEVEKIRMAIEEKDSGKVINLSVGKLDEIKKDGLTYTIQPIFYDLSKDGDTINNKLQYIVVKRRFLKYKFDSIYVAKGK